jgi:uncharacterized membrane protein SirB2
MQPKMIYLATAQTLVSKDKMGKSLQWLGKTVTVLVAYTVVGQVLQRQTRNRRNNVSVA